MVPALNGIGTDVACVGVGLIPVIPTSSWIRLWLTARLIYNRTMTSTLVYVSLGTLPPNARFHGY